MNKDITEYRTLVFDCDGVVLNSNKIKTQAFYEAAKHFGHEPAQALVDYHVQNGGISRYAKFEYFITQILKQELDETLNQDLLQRFAQAVKDGLMNCEVADGLEALRKKTKHTNWLIVSGGDQVELREVFAARGLDKYFNGGIFGSPDTKDIILEREMKSNNINPNALFLGDSKYDYQAAKTAELDFIFLSDWTEVKNYQAWCESEDILITKNIKSVANTAAIKQPNRMNFQSFSWALKKETRYILNKSVTAFLDLLESDLNKRATLIKKQEYFFRAQKGGVLIEDDISPFQEDRMRPMKDAAYEGRANPKGISYLYLATDEKTAISEMRPWVCEKVTVAKFDARKELKIVDLTMNQIDSNLAAKLNFPIKISYDFLDDNLVSCLRVLSDVEACQFAWYQVNEAFSIPQTKTDDSADYIPTQVIAEFIKSKGFDGLMFRSSVSIGKNLVIFEQNNVRYIDSFLREVIAVDVDYQAAINKHTGFTG